VTHNTVYNTGLEFHSLARTSAGPGIQRAEKKNKTPSRSRVLFRVP
jgi:hypothetical protein